MFLKETKVKIWYTGTKYDIVIFSVSTLMLKSTFQGKKVKTIPINIMIHFTLLLNVKQSTYGREVLVEESSEKYKQITL